MHIYIGFVKTPVFGLLLCAYVYICIMGGAVCGWYTIYMRRCYYCRSKTPISDYCADCLLAYKQITGSRKFRSRLRNYGIDESQYFAMLRKQKGRCAICKEPAKDLMLHIDHDHRCCERGSCGRCVRGLLCANCNKAIGMFKESPESLWNAMKYLDKFPFWHKSQRF